MARRVIKFRHPYSYSFSADMMLVISAIASAVAVFFLLFIFVKYSGVIIPRPEFEGGPLRGLPVESVLYKPSAAEVVKDVLIEGDDRSSGAGYRGQSDVSFFKYSLTPGKGGKLKKLVFSYSGKAREYDVSGLQLYINDEFIAEKPFFEGKAVFDQLNFEMEENTPVEFEVKGKIGNEAYSSDRIQIGIAGEDDIEIRSNFGGKMSVGRLSGEELPIWGRYVSIIGGRK